MNPKGRLYQFRLLPTLLLMIPIALLCLASSIYLDDRPINWQDYSRESLTRNVSDNHITLVFFTADWDLTALSVENRAIETFWIRRLVRQNNVVSLRADCTNWAYNAHDELGSTNYPPTPIVAIFSSSTGTNPVILGDAFTEKELYNALSTIIGLH